MHLTCHKYLKLFIHMVLLIIISESKKAIKDDWGSVKSTQEPT